MADFAFPLLQPVASDPAPLPQPSSPTAEAAPAPVPVPDLQPRLPLTAYSTVTHASPAPPTTSVPDLAPRLPLTAYSTVTHAASKQSPAEGSSTPRLPLTAFSTVIHAAGPSPPPSDPAPPAVSSAGPGSKQHWYDKGARSQVEYLRSEAQGAPAASTATPQRPITLQELKQHKSAADAWVALKGRVYDVTRYLQYHPGGAKVLLKAAGTDATDLFAKFHPWVDAHYILAASQLGVLAAGGQEEQREGAGKAAGDAE